MRQETGIKGALMMQTEFILGRACSGKTIYCYQQIENELKKESYSSLILLVPEQFNLQTQIDLSQRLYPGLLRVEVTSFNTLAREVFKEVGKADLPTIDDLERIMILKKIIEEHKKELTFFKKNIYSDGFIESMNRLITVFEQSSIEVTALEELITDQSATLLFKSKLADTKIIYNYFNEYIRDRFMTAEKTLNLLAQSIHKSQKLRSTKIWIDGFYGFSSAQFFIIKELIKKAEDVKITLPSDKLYSLEEKIQETHPFYESVKTYQRLIGLCHQENVRYSSKYLSTQSFENSPVSPEIAYIEENYFKTYSKVFSQEPKDVSLCLYSNKNEEIEQTAKKIIHLVSNEGYRYRDITLMVGDLAAYKSRLQSLFNEYEIPYFLDMKRNIHTNCLVAVIEGALEIVTSSYSYKSVMAFLRTYMLNIAMEDIDHLENHLLAYGIKGKKKWYERWRLGEEECEKEDQLNSIREKVLEPLQKFETAVEAKKNRSVIKVIDATKCLYHFLEDIHAYESLKCCTERYQLENNKVLVLENTQIWGEVIEVFERLTAILGEEYVSLAAYKRIISTSFSCLKMGIIPPSKDQVLIGTIDRTRLPRIKAHFILGVNEGVIPKVSQTIDLFSDMDKLTLSKLCKEKDSAKDSFCDKIINQPLYESNFSVYTALTRATHKLFISAIQADDNGKTLRPSLVYYKIKKMFKGTTPAVPKSILDQVYRPLPTFGYIGSLLRESMEGRVTGEEWKDIVSWYYQDEKWRSRLIGLSDSLFYTNQQQQLEEATTKILYEKDLKTSVSRLETFKSCPCCYFIRYGIKAEERKVFSWSSATIGTLFHTALERYPKELENLKTTWTDANEEQMSLAVHKATDFAVNHHHLAYKDIGKFKYTASKLEKMAKRAIRALTAHLKNGQFIPLEYEVNFAEGSSLPPIEIELESDRSIIITGQIDRIDIYYKDFEHQYIKILDYKTGNKNFSLLEVYYGLQLQLLLYLDAYLKLNKHYEPGGIFYFHINSAYVSYQAGMSDEALQNSQLKQFKLSGLVLEALEVIQAMDKENRGDMIPASINKDGTLKKGSSAASYEQIEALREYIISTIRQLGKEILSGKVSATPFKLGDKYPCLYCAYHTICQFDENLTDNTYAKMESLDKERIWEKICRRKEEK